VRPLRVLARACSQGDHTGNDKCTGQERWDPVAGLRLDPDLGIADLDVMIFGVRDGHGEGEHAEDQKYRAKQS
jgi:hypothetical protein